MKDYQKNGKKTILTLSAKEFIRRFPLHVLPLGFTRIRHFGRLSSTWEKEKFPALQQALGKKVVSKKEEEMERSSTFFRSLP